MKNQIKYEYVLISRKLETEIIVLLISNKSFKSLQLLSTQKNEKKLIINQILVF